MMIHADIWWYMLIYIEKIYEKPRWHSPSPSLVTLMHLEILKKKIKNFIRKKNWFWNFFLKISFFSYIAGEKHVNMHDFQGFRRKFRILLQVGENQEFSPKNMSFQNFSRSDHPWVKNSGGSNGIIFSPIWGLNSAEKLILKFSISRFSRFSQKFKISDIFS